MASIEEEIKQEKFKNEHIKMVINLMFTANWISAFHIKWLKPHGLSPQQFNILRILRGQNPKPASIGLLSERMLDRNSNASRLVDKLVAKNLVNRKECPLDRRQVDIVITEQGLDLLKLIDVEFENKQRQFECVSMEEAQQINSILDKLRS